MAPCYSRHVSSKNLPDASRDAEFRAKLSDAQYLVTRKGATEPAFTGAYTDEEREGTYRCVCCSAVLFTSKEKYHSGCGWPSFFRQADGANIKELDDTTYGMRRIEVRCGSCDAHLGHVFPDGPAPTGIRYCINSVALDLDVEK